MACASRKMRRRCSKENPSGSIEHFEWTIPTNLQPNTEYRIRGTSVVVTGVVFLTPPFEIFTLSGLSSSSSLTSELNDETTSQIGDGDGIDPILIGIIGASSILIIVAILILIIVLIIIIVIVFILGRNSKSKSFNEMELQSGPATQELFDPDADVADEESTTTTTTGRGIKSGSLFSTSLLTP